MHRKAKRGDICRLESSNKGGIELNEQTVDVYVIIGDSPREETRTINAVEADGATITIYDVDFSCWQRREKGNENNHAQP